MFSLNRLLSPTHRAPSALLVGVLLAVFLFGHLNWRVPALRLVSPMANGFGLLLIFACPLVAVVVGQRVLSGRSRVLFALALAPVVAYSVLMLPLILMGAITSNPGKPEPSFLPITSAAARGSHLVLYRSNCGATCNFGVVLRQERRVAGAFLLVRDVASWYPADTGTLMPLGDDRVAVHVRYLGADSIRATRTPADLVATVRPWVYF
jgi:hypothetical protein